jgi:WhiB family redox-sensing transcriptional regulator
MSPTKEYMEQLRQRQELPPMADIAARIRDGESYRDIAKEYGLEKQGLANRLRTAGYRYDTGEVERDARLREMKEHLRSTLLTWGEPWMADAICAQTDPEAFFPEKGGSTREAKRVCMSCPVRETCLEWALARGEYFGIFGGKSERERRKIAKERKAGLAA